MHGTYIKIIVLKSSGSLDSAIEIKAEFYTDHYKMMWNWKWGKYQNIYATLLAFVVGLARMMDFWVLYRTGQYVCSEVSVERATSIFRWFDYASITSSVNEFSSS